MAKIDITKIEGFDKMSAEDKVKALLGYELPEADHTGYVKKETFDKTATELASFKKKEREALSEAERKAAEQADKITEQEGKITQLTEEIEAFKTREQTATYAAQYVGLGYDAELAQATAAALTKGDMKTVFANQAAFIKAHDKAYKATLMGQGKDSTPPAGSGSEGTNYAKLRAEAESRGDLAAVSYYTRLEQQNKA